MKIIQGKPERALSLEELPVKICNTIQERITDRILVIAVKTALKPTPNVPIIWIIVTQHSLLLCSTNRPHGVWREYKLQAIDEVRHTSATSVNIIWNDLDQADFQVIFPTGTDPNWLEELVREINLRK